MPTLGGFLAPVRGRIESRITSARAQEAAPPMSGTGPAPAIHQGRVARLRIIFGHSLAPSTKPQWRPIEKYTLPVSRYASPSAIPNKKRPIRVGIAIAG